MQTKKHDPASNTLTENFQTPLFKYTFNSILNEQVSFMSSDPHVCHQGKILNKLAGVQAARLLAVYDFDGFLLHC